jgi:HupE / UreJ protein
MVNDRRIMDRRAAALLAALVVAVTASLAAHDIPNDVIVHAFVRPEGSRLRLLVRAPLGAMRDVQFPTRGQNFLDLAKAESSLREAAALWIGPSIEVYEGATRLEPLSLVAVRVSLPSDRSFASYETALAQITGPPLPQETELVWNQGLLDVMYELPIRSDRSEFSVQPAFARLGIRVVTVIRFVPAAGVERAFELVGDPGPVRLDPRWHQAAWRFVKFGFFHILDGVDHLLFLLCLVIPFRRLRPLILVVTAFTVAHSITLAASAFELTPDALWFPPLIETLIAASIVYMALENIVGATRLERRWVIAFAFGLVHGFGFSFALRETLQFAGAHLLTSLLSFNVGVELGQVLVLLLLVPILQFAFRHVVAERLGTIILSVIVAHTAWHWMLDRGADLGRYDWRAPDAAAMAVAVRWLLALLILRASLWVGSILMRGHRRRPDREVVSDES